MAIGVTRIADVIVPQIFSPYVQQLTQEKSRIIRSGALQMDPEFGALLNGAGLTFNSPSMRDLDNDADNISSDDPAVLSSPNKIGTSNEIQVRLSRNNSWSTMDLTKDLMGADPMNAIASRVSDYWSRRLQAAYIATVNGVFADNAAAPSSTEHVQNDMTYDISGPSFVDGVTSFSAEAFIDATLTMGDSMEDLTLVVMHSIVYARALKNNLIDFVVDSTNGGAVRVPTFLGREVVVDDGVPRSGAVFNTWLFGAGAIRGGMGSPAVPTETDRLPSSGNGAGQEVLYNRTEWLIHPVGCAYVGTAPNGGPNNLATSNNLAAAASWQRVFPQRKQIKIARLVSREF